LTRDRKPSFFYGYVVVVAAFCIQVVAWGIFVTFGIFFNPLLVEFGWSRATISGAASLCMLIIGFVSIIVGRLTDRFGPRGTVLVSGCLLGLGCLLMSQVNTIWQLYLFYGVMVGIGIGGVDVPLLSTIARWFVRRRGIMSGIIKVGAGVGMLIMPPAVNWLISLYAWRASYFIIGIIALVVIVSAAQFLKRDPGLIRQLPDCGEELEVSHESSVDGGFSLQEAIHAKQFWMICVIFLLGLFCSRTIVVHIAPHAVDLGISTTNAANVLAAIGGTSIIGRLIMGSMSDRLGSRLAITTCLLVLIVAFLWLQLARELWMLYLFASVYGFAHGGFFTLMSPWVAELFGTGSHGVIFGIVFFSGTIGGTIGPVLAGHIFDIAYSYQPAFLVCVILSLMAFMLALFLRPITHVREKG